MQWYKDKSPLVGRFSVSPDSWSASFKLKAFKKGVEWLGEVWLAIRPKTFLIALLPVLVGTALAYSVTSQVHWVLSGYAYLSALALQIGTNLFNDVFDFQRGSEDQQRLGPRRVMQSGPFTSKQVYQMGWVAFGVAALWAIPLVLAGGLPILWLGLAVAVVGYAYTAGPYPLAYLGGEEFWVVLCYGWLGVGGIYYLNTGRLDWVTCGLAGAQVGCCVVWPLMLNQLRDTRIDGRAGRKTTVLRLGRPLSLKYLAFWLSLPLVVGLAWFYWGLGGSALLPFLVVPRLRRLYRKVLQHQPSALYNEFLEEAISTGFRFCLLLSLGFVLHPWAKILFERMA